MLFKVIRHHQGDQAYAPGDIRDAVKGEVAHLIGTVLIEIQEDDEAKRLADEAAAAEEAEVKRLADEAAAAEEAAASTGAARKK